MPQASELTLEDAHKAIASLSKAVADSEAQVLKLNEFLPILGEVFAGKIGGTSDESAAIFAAFDNADLEALKAALDKAAGETAAQQAQDQMGLK